MTPSKMQKKGQEPVDVDAKLQDGTELLEGSLILYVFYHLYEAPILMTEGAVQNLDGLN